MQPVDRLTVHVVVDNTTDMLSSRPKHVASELRVLRDAGMTELAGELSRSPGGKSRLEKKSIRARDSRRNGPYWKVEQARAPDQGGPRLPLRPRTMACSGGPEISSIVDQVALTRYASPGLNSKETSNE